MYSVPTLCDRYNSDIEIDVKSHIHKLPNIKSVYEFKFFFCCPLHMDIYHHKYTVGNGAQAKLTGVDMRYGYGYGTQNNFIFMLFLTGI